MSTAKGVREIVSEAPKGEENPLRQWLVSLISTVIAGWWTLFWRPEAWERGMNYKFNREAQNTVPPESVLIRARRLGVISKADYQGAMTLFGYSPETSEILFQAGIEVPSPEAIMTMKFRGLINENQAKELFKKLGYSDDIIEPLMKAYEFYPSPSDLITFAVREAYSEDAIRLFRTLEDLPAQFIEDAKKAGVSEDWAKKYWIAHWRLPSVEQGFEMLHRGVITWDELNILLRALDIMPYFRDKLLQISYNPYTRVDTRRLYAMGLLTEEEVYKNYRDLGYDDEHAKKMTEWVKLSVLEDVKTISKSQIRELWEYGDLSNDDAVRLLMHIGYDRNSAETLLTLWEHEKSNQVLKDQIATIENLYLAGAITYEEAFDRLTALGISSGRLNKVLSEMLRKKRSEIKIPGKDDLLKWLRLELITPEEYFESMELLGYRKEDALRYIASDVKLPSKPDLDKWFKLKIIDEEEYRFYMRKLKYSEKEIEKYLEQLYKELGAGEEA